MPKYIFFCLLSLCVISVEAQKEQICTVREQNSKRKPIANAQVIFEDAKAAISQSDGTVRLVFQTKNAGEWTFKDNIYCKGFELVNEKELEKIKLSADNQLGVDIILARAGTVDSMKAVYFGISNKSLKEGFEREKRRLRKERDAAKLNTEQYIAQLEELNKNFEEEEKNLAALSEKFARVNFDDVSAVYQQALEEFKGGNINKAISILESIDPVKRTQKIIEEKKRLEQREAELQADRQALEKEKRQQIDNLRLLADMYAASFNLLKAEHQYDQLFQLDSTDLSILSDAAGFYKENHRYEKALHLYPLIIAHPQSKDWKIAETNGDMGLLYLTIGNLSAALEAITQCFEFYQKANQTEPENKFYKANLAFSYATLGSIYIKLGNFDKALSLLEQDANLTQELCAVYPNDTYFKKSLAISYSELGSVHAELDSLDKALEFLKRSMSITKQLYIEQPNNEEHKRDLAASYMRLGDIHKTLDNPSTALDSFLVGTKICEELYAAHPNNVQFKNDLIVAYGKLGTIYTILEDSDKALSFFEKNNTLAKELHADYPCNVDFKGSLAISYAKLSLISTKKNDFTKAIDLLKKAEVLFLELVRDAPQNAQYRQYLGFVQESLEIMK